MASKEWQGFTAAMYTKNRRKCCYQAITLKFPYDAHQNSLNGGGSRPNYSPFLARSTARSKAPALFIDS